MAGRVPRRLRTVAATALGLALLGALPADAGERPRRIASLNVCTDELLVALADRDEIASLSPLAHDRDLSTVAHAAAMFTDNLNSAEEVVRERPDLVLTEDNPADATAPLLRRLGIRVESVEVVDRLEQVAPTLRRIAAWLGREDRGEALLAKMNATLASVQASARHERALFYEPSGWSDGPGTMKDDILVAAGYVNQAARLGIEGYEPLALERVVADPPDLIITESYRPDEISLAEVWVEHPALRAVKHRMALPTKLFLCGTPAIADAVATLAAAQSPSLASR
jgi:iron complex transport system substrate-binding protein